MWPGPASPVVEHWLCKFSFPGDRGSILAVGFSFQIVNALISDGGSNISDKRHSHNLQIETAVATTLLYEEGT